MKAMKRIILGTLSGVVATVIMDAAGQLIWERTAERARQREREVEPKFPLEVLAEQIANSLLIPDAARNLGATMHWGIGAVCGALHGLLEAPLRAERDAFGQPIAMGMLAIDEFGFAAAGLCPWPNAFPWQTHARATASHVVYGAAVAILYEGLKAYAHNRFRPS